MDQHIVETPTAPPETVNTPAMVAMIERVAMNPEVDVDKMERLLAMQKDIVDRESEIAYSNAMSQVQAQCQVVSADRRNTQTNSVYATLGAVNKKITPIYTEAGFALSFGEETSPLDDHIRIICDCMHNSGHTKRYFYDSPIDDKGIKGQTNKTAAHARGSAISYGRRYLTNMIFNLSTGDDDDGNSACMAQTISEAQIKTIRSLLKQAEVTEKQFCNRFKLNTIEGLNVSTFNNAVDQLKQRINRAS